MTSSPQTKQKMDISEQIPIEILPSTSTATNNTVSSTTAVKQPQVLKQIDAWENPEYIRDYLCKIFKTELFDNINPLNGRMPVELTARQVIVEKVFVFKGSLLDFEKCNGPITISLNELTSSDDEYYPKNQKTGEILKNYNIEKAFLTSFAILHCENPFKIKIGVKSDLITNYKSSGDNPSVRFILEQGYAYAVNASSSGKEKLLFNTDQINISETLIKTFGPANFQHLTKGIILLPDIPDNYKPPSSISNNDDDDNDDNNTFSLSPPQVNVKPIYKQWVITSTKHAIVKAARHSIPKPSSANQSPSLSSPIAQIKLITSDKPRPSSIKYGDWVFIDRQLIEKLILSSKDVIYKKLKTFDPRSTKIEICNFFSSKSWGTCINKENKVKHTCRGKDCRCCVPPKNKEKNDIIDSELSRNKLKRDITTVHSLKIRVRMIYIVFPKNMDNTICTDLSYSLI